MPRFPKGQVAGLIQDVLAADGASDDEIQTCDRTLRPEVRSAERVQAGELELRRGELRK